MCMLNFTLHCSRSYRSWDMLNFPLHPSRVLTPSILPQKQLCPFISPSTTTASSTTLDQRQPLPTPWLLVSTVLAWCASIDNSSYRIRSWLWSKRRAAALREGGGVLSDESMTSQFTKLFSFILANVHDPAAPDDAGSLHFLYLKYGLFIIIATVFSTIIGHLCSLDYFLQSYCQNPLFKDSTKRSTNLYFPAILLSNALTHSVSLVHNI